MEDISFLGCIKKDWGIFEDQKVYHRVLYLNLKILTFQLCGYFLVVLGHIWHPRLISLCSELYSLNFNIFGARAFWALFEKMGHLYEPILTPFFKLLDALSTDMQTRWNGEGLWAKSSQVAIWAIRKAVWIFLKEVYQYDFCVDHESIARSGWEGLVRAVGVYERFFIHHHHT